MPKKMSVTEFIDKFNNDPEYKKDLISKLGQIKSRFTEKELEEHKKDVQRLLNFYNSDKK